MITDPGVDHLARPGPPLFPRGDEQLVEHTPVEGDDVAAEPPVLLVAAHDALQAALQDPDDPAFGALGRRALHPRHHPVPVQGFLEVGRGDVDVRLARPAALGHHEAEARGVAGEPPHHQVHARREADPRPADLHQLPVLQQTAQDGRELAAGLGGETQPAHQVADGDGLPVVGEELEDAVAKRDGRGGHRGFSS